jgi:hypothetical protein
VPLSLHGAGSHLALDPKCLRSLILQGNRATAACLARAEMAARGGRIPKDWCA